MLSRSFSFFMKINFFVGKSEPRKNLALKVFQQISFSSVHDILDEVE